MNGKDKIVPDSFALLRKGKRTFALRKGFERILLQMGIEGGQEDLLHRLDGRTKSFSGRGTVFAVPFPRNPSEAVVVRKYLRGGLFRFLNRDLYFSACRALKELCITEEASLAGLHTPQILAVVSEKAGPLCSRHWILSREIKDSLDLPAALKKGAAGSASAGVRHGWIASAARAVRRMHDLGIFHRDLNIKNILVRGEGELFLIDFDGAKRYNPLPLKRRMGNLFRLLRSAEKWKRKGLGIQKTDQYRFFREYAGTDKTLAEEILKGFRSHGGHLFWHRLGWRLSAFLKAFFSTEAKDKEE